MNPHFRRGQNEPRAAWTAPALLQTPGTDPRPNLPFTPLQPGTGQFTQSPISQLSHPQQPQRPAHLNHQTQNTSILVRNKS